MSGDETPIRPDVEGIRKLAFERVAVFGRLCDGGISAEMLRALCDYILALEQRPPDNALREALKANVAARREASGGCCDWSCDLCSAAVAALEESAQ